MGLFSRGSRPTKRCPECRFYVMLNGQGFCSRNAPAGVNMRILSEEGIKRVCARCPAEMTCATWAGR